jgi:Gas vesicle protein
MARARKAGETRGSVAGQVLETPESSLLDLLDHLLNKGVMATGDITLGVAGIDLIYLRLSSILCAADRVLPRERQTVRGRSRRRPSRFPKRNG